MDYAEIAQANEEKIEVYDPKGDKDLHRMDMIDEVDENRDRRMQAG